MDTMRLFAAEADAALTQNAFHGDVFDALSKQVAEMGDDLDLDLDGDLIDLEF
jgi:5,10-methylenetetrahydrofolate reductase